MAVYSLARCLCYVVIATREISMTNSVPSPEDSADHVDRRAYARVSLALPAFLQAYEERYAVQLVDLSAGGAKLTCPASLSPGTAVILDCGTFGHAAVVRWQNAG